MDNYYKQSQITDNNFTTIRADLANIYKTYKDTEGSFYYNILKTMNIKNLDNIPIGYYNLYLVQSGDNYNNISYRQYGTIDYWWIICKFNNVINPIEFPTPGSYIKLPTIDLVNSLVNIINQ